MPAPSSTFQLVGGGPRGCLCLKWLEDVSGFGGRYRGPGYLTAAEALQSWRAAGFATDRPQPGDFVFFAPAASNGGAGHVGEITAPGKFTSLWCDGRVMDGPITLFAQQNGTRVSGYISRQKLGL